MHGCLFLQIGSYEMEIVIMIRQTLLVITRILRKYWKPRGVICATDRRIKGYLMDEMKSLEKVVTSHRIGSIKLGVWTGTLPVEFS